MIVKNPIERSAFVVYSVWYIGLYVIGGLFVGVWPWWVVMDYPLSLVVVAIGALLGLGATLGVTARKMHQRETEVKSGHHDEQIHVTLGDLPGLDPVTRGSEADTAIMVERLHKMKWWSHVTTHFPQHAAAIEAVASVMAREPLLPASPIPGGHAGRTLFEHSLAVASQILRDAYRWRYTGQRYKNGRMRVPLRDASRGFHKFTGADVGLLALTGFAHDLGKLTCYVRCGDPTGQWKTVPVNESVPNHDTEGAHILRRIPEIMALPYRDRRALLLACGFYHHPAAITVDGSIDDRMRSLVELLSASDVATGMAEGDSSASTSQEANAIDEEDDAWTGEGGESRTEVSMTTDRSKLPREMQILYNIIEQSGAIGAGPDRYGNRVGYKHDGKLWLTDQRVLGRVAGNGGSDLDVANTTPRNGNASIFTVQLLTALADRHLLLTRFKDTELKPSRALFKVKTKGMKNITSGVFVVLGTLLTSIDQQPDDKAMEIVEPLWGAGSGHKVTHADEAAGPGEVPPQPNTTPANSAEGAGRPGMGGEGPSGPPAAERQGVGSLDATTSLENGELDVEGRAPAAALDVPNDTVGDDDLVLEDPDAPVMTAEAVDSTGDPTGSVSGSRSEWDSFVRDLVEKHPDMESRVVGGKQYVYVRDATLRAAVELELGVVDKAVKQWADYYEQGDAYVLTVPPAAA